MIVIDAILFLKRLHMSRDRLICYCMLFDCLLCAAVHSAIGSRNGSHGNWAHR